MVISCHADGQFGMALLWLLSLVNNLGATVSTCQGDPVCLVNAPLV